MFAPKFRRMGRIIRSTMSQDRLEFAIIGEYDIVGGEYFWNFKANTGRIWSESRGNHIERISRRIVLGELHLANYIWRIISGELHLANYIWRIISRESRGELYLANHKANHKANYIGQIIFGKLYWANYIGQIILGKLYWANYIRQIIIISIRSIKF